MRIYARRGSEQVIGHTANSFEMGDRCCHSGSLFAAAPIAELFDVSTDELLGKTEKNYDDIISKIGELKISEENHCKRYSKCIKMLKTNPKSLVKKTKAQS